MCRSLCILIILESTFVKCGAICKTKDGSITGSLSAYCISVGAEISGIFFLAFSKSSKGKNRAGKAGSGESGQQPQLATAVPSAGTPDGFAAGAGPSTAIAGGRADPASTG